MAKVMPFEDTFGTMHEASYWCVVQVNLNKIARDGQVTILGFVGRDARLAGKQPIGARTYSINPAQYDSFFSPEVIKAPDNDQFKAAYMLIAATKDIVKVPATEEEPEVLGNFFDDALDV